MRNILFMAAMTSRENQEHLNFHINLYIFVLYRVCAENSLKGIQVVSNYLAEDLPGFYCKKTYDNHWKCAICKPGTFSASSVAGYPCTECLAGKKKLNGL
jgi:hypothetical protein